jgi:hypothetical protein
MGRIVPGTDANATITVASKGKSFTKTVPVTVEPDGRIRFVMPAGRIVPGTDAKITIKFFNGTIVESSGALNLAPGAPVTLSASGAAVA